VNRTRAAAWSWLLLALAAAGTLMLALDGRHYWHDARFLFATTQFPFGDVLDGRFNPEQAWSAADERSAAGFYTSKVAHLWLLRSLYTRVPPEAGGIELAVALSVLLVMAAAVLGGLLIARVTESRGLGQAGGAAFLLLPVTPYLAGKQVAEVTAVPLTAGALLLVWCACRREEGRLRWPLALAGGAMLFLAAASRPDSLFAVLGFLAAAWWFAPGPAGRSALARVAASALGVAVVAYALLVAAIGAAPGDYFRYLTAFLAAPSRPAAMSVLSLAIFAGILYPVAALALLSHRRRAAAFFAVWWVAAWVPAIAITAAFMVEPRYLAHGALPLAGLVALGGEVVVRRAGRAAAPLLAGLALVLLPANWFAIQLMPYELDRPRLLLAVDRIIGQSPDAVVLLPWTYTDLNFLRAARPGASLYSVHSPEGLEVGDDVIAAWHDRYSDWYEGRHLTDAGALAELLKARPVFYLGWHRYPPVEFVDGLTERLGFGAVAGALRRLDLLDHLETSWVPGSPEIRLEPAGQLGMYRYFRLHPVGAAASPGAGGGPVIEPPGGASLVRDIVLPPAGPDDGSGGVIAADLTGDGRMELLVTRPGQITAVDLAGAVLWSRAAPIRLTMQSEVNGLPGWHAAGSQAADVTGDGAAEVLYLTRAGRVDVLDGASGRRIRSIALPPTPEGGPWEHLAVADFRGLGNRDLLLQATNLEGYRVGRYLAAVALDGLPDADTLPVLWQRDDFLAAAHGPARLADLTGDGRDEVIGGSIVDASGTKLFELEVDGHIDAIAIADVRPDLPGLEVVATEETRQSGRFSRPYRVARVLDPVADRFWPRGNRVFLYNGDGLIWASQRGRREAQNVAIGQFAPERPGLEIWNRSRYDEDQEPFVLDARGRLLASYSLSRAAPATWTRMGVEVIAPIHWTGGERQLIAAKARHEAGPVAVLDPLTARFVLVIEEQADRIYVADVLGDWREEIVVLAGDRIRVYANPAPNPRPGLPSLWDLGHYRRAKQNWNYYSP
jgi:hypothetical protein